MTRITALIENSAEEHRDLQAEHGLSLFIESGGSRVVFDTGAGEAFLENARKLGIDPASADHIVLSHGHFDHTGGLMPLLERMNHAASVHVGDQFFLPKFSRGKRLEYVGNDFVRDDILLRGHKVVTHRAEACEILPDVFVLAGLSGDTPPSRRFVVPRGEEYEADCFTDEIALAVRTAEGLVLIVGCSHPGILAIIASVSRRFSERIHSVIGGTHLIDADDRRLEETAQALQTLEGTRWYFCHCTGSHALEYLQNRCPGFAAFHTGDRLTTA